MSIDTSKNPIEEVTKEELMDTFAQLSDRGKDWIWFSGHVITHIENYTVPQYGDKPDDPVEDWSPDQCMKAIEKYARRHGNNSREGQELIDCFKIAHFAQLTFLKLLEEGDIDTND